MLFVLCILSNVIYKKREIESDVCVIFASVHGHVRFAEKPWLKVLFADLLVVFAGLVPANQPAGFPLKIQPVSAATVFLSHNNQPVSAKFQTNERGQ